MAEVLNNSKDWAAEVEKQAEDLRDEQKKLGEAAINAAEAQPSAEDQQKQIELIEDVVLSKSKYKHLDKKAEAKRQRQVEKYAEEWATLTGRPKAELAAKIAEKLAADQAPVTQSTEETVETAETTEEPEGEEPEDTEEVADVVEVEQTPEQKKADFAEYLKGQRDRMGNQLFSSATIDRLLQEYNGGEIPDLVDEERQKVLAAAREIQEQINQDETERILNGRELKEYVKDAQGDIRALQDEIKSMESRLKFADAGVRERLIGAAKKELNFMQRKLRLVHRVKENLPWDPVKDGQWFGMGDLSELPEGDELDEEISDEAVGELDDKTELNEQAAGGELDPLNPNSLTSQEILMQAAEAVAMALGDPEIVRRMQERLVVDQQPEAPQPFVSEPTYEEVKAVPDAYTKPVDWFPPAGEQSGETSAESGEQMKQGLFERLKNRAGFKRAVRWAKGVGLAALAALSVTATTALGRTPAMQSVGNAMPEPEATSSTVSMEQNGGGMDREMAMQLFEQLGDLTIDTRFEQANGTRYDYTFDYESPDKLDQSFFGVDKSEFYGDREGTTEALLDICRNQPEVLASTVAAFPSILEACGLERGMTPIQIDDMLSNGEMGGEQQAKLLETLETALRADSTNFEFYEEYNREGTWYMYNMLGNGGANTPVNLKLNTINAQRNGEKQVRIRVAVLDENGNILGYETGDYNMPCGFQLNFEYAAPVAEAAVEDASAANIVAQGVRQMNVARRPVVQQEGGSGGSGRPVERPVERPTETPVEKPAETPTETPVEKPSEVPTEKPAETPDEPETPPPAPEETEKPETVKTKDAENEVKVVEDGGQDGEVGVTEEGDLTVEETEAPEVVPENNAEVKTENMVADETATEEEQEQARQDQAEANANEVTQGVSDEDFENYVGQILGQS